MAAVVRCRFCFGLGGCGCFFAGLLGGKGCFGLGFCLSRFTFCSGGSRFGCCLCFGSLLCFCGLCSGVCFGFTSRFLGSFLLCFGFCCCLFGCGNFFRGCLFCGRFFLRGLNGCLDSCSQSG